jgi:hypothetical protein
MSLSGEKTFNTSKLPTSFRGKIWLVVTFYGGRWSDGDHSAKINL